MKSNKIKYFIFVFLLLFVFSVNAQQPINDLCINAITITNVNAWCSDSAEFTNVNATCDTSLSIPTCWISTSSERDVWFKFYAIASAVNVTVSGLGTNLGTVDYPHIALYSGTCSSLTEVGCGQSYYIHGFSNAYITALSIGQTYYIRISDSYNFPGSFKLCVNNFTPPVLPGKDCNTASYLCNKNPITKDTVNGSGVIQEGYGSCIDLFSYGPERNSAWYTWKAANSGTLTFTINPNFPEDDIDFVVYELLNNDCNNKTILRCEASGGYGCHGATGINLTSTDTVEGAGCGYGQDNFVKYIDMIAGRTYALLVNNWSMSHVGLNNGFTINFGGSGNFLGPIANFYVSTSSTCFENNSFTFVDNSTGALSYHWDFGQDASIDTASTAGPHTVSYSTPGLKVIVLSLTGQGGCDVIYFTQLYISEREVNLGNDTTICYNDSLILDAGQGFNTYLWDDGNTNQVYKILPDSFGSGTIPFSVTVTDGGCTIIDTINITINKPFVDLGPDTNICIYNSIELDVGKDAYNYLWSDGSDKHSIVVDSSDIKNGLATFYVLVYDEIGCMGSDTIVVNTIPRPDINLIQDFTVCSDDTFTIDAGSGFDEYLWSDLSKEQIITINNGGIPGSTMAYSVLVSKDGCENSDTVEISFIDCTPIEKGIIITPNPFIGKFSIYIKGHDALNFSITNVHGQFLYHGKLDNNISENYSKEFDLSGCAKGVYFLKFTNPEVSIIKKMVLQ